MDLHLIELESIVRSSLLSCCSSSISLPERLKKSVLTQRYDKDVSQYQAVSIADASVRNSNDTIPNVHLDLSLSVLYNLSQSQYRNGLIDECQSTLRLILQDGSHTSFLAKVRTDIASTQVEKKEYSDALKSYRIALDIIPSRERRSRQHSLCNIGTSYFLLNSFTEASTAFEQAMLMETMCSIDTADTPSLLSLLGDAPIATYNFIMCSIILGQGDKILRGFERICSINFPAVILKSSVTNHIMDSKSMSIANRSNTDTKQKENDFDILSKETLNRRICIEDMILRTARVIIEHSCIAPTFQQRYACIQTILLKSKHFCSVLETVRVMKDIDMLRYQRVASPNFIFSEDFQKSYDHKGDTEKSSYESLKSNQSISDVSAIFLALGDASRSYMTAVTSIQKSTSYLPSIINFANSVSASGDLCSAKAALDTAIEFRDDIFSCNDSNMFNKETLNHQVVAVYNAGLIAYEMGLFDESLKYFMFLYNNSYDTSVETLCQIGRVHESQKNYLNAICWYKRVLDNVPTDAWMRLRIGTLYVYISNEDEALKYFKEAQHILPNEPNILSQIASHSLRKGDIPDALNIYKLINSLDSSIPTWGLAIASCFRRLNCDYKAIEVYEQVHIDFPDNIECLKHLILWSDGAGLHSRKQQLSVELKIAKLKEDTKKQEKSGTQRLVI